ncbi:tail fiber protein [Cellulophaga phage phi19:3]|uniref:Structural protein n=1 Tax=Cellulophaga phage phi19:3 TaxID=1327971 RepID=R9ZZV7_9CAUD|nr:tail fiber protein [Cellulophaga phage phi19:3]AGO47493.1 structural protein [Cellulophaga phage phi19:3]
MKQTINIVLFFILSLGLNAQTVEGTVGSDGSLIPYNVSGGLDETAVDAKIETSNALNWYDITANRVLTSNEGGGLFLNESANDYTLTIPTQTTGLYESDVVYTAINSGSGSIIVRPESGLTLESKELLENKKGSIARKGSNKWIYFGDWTDYVVVNLNSTNASNPTSEDNSTTGFTLVGSGAVLTSDTDSFIGTYAIKLTSAGSVSTYASYVFSANAGDTFSVSFRMKTTDSEGSTGSTAWTNSSGGAVGDYIEVADGWVSRTYNITATATGNISLRFYASASSSEVTSDNIFIDNLIIEKTN